MIGLFVGYVLSGIYDRIWLVGLVGWLVDGESVSLCLGGNLYGTLVFYGRIRDLW